MAGIPALGQDILLLIAAATASATKPLTTARLSAALQVAPSEAPQAVEVHWEERFRAARIVIASRCRQTGWPGRIRFLTRRQCTHRRRRTMGWSAEHGFILRRYS